MIFPLAARYFSRSDAMTFELDSTFVTLSLPFRYSFCASTIMSAESDGDAVLAGRPRMERKVGGAIVRFVDFFVSVDVVWYLEIR